MFIQLVTIRGVNWTAPRHRERVRFKACLTNEIKLSEKYSSWPIKLSVCSSAAHIRATFTITAKHTIKHKLLLSWRAERKKKNGLLSSHIHILDGDVSLLLFFALPKTHSGNRCCNKSRMTPSRVILYFISSEWNTDPGDSCDSGSFQFHVLLWFKTFQVRSYY